MKKYSLLVVTAIFVLSCNSNPSATGDSIIMEHEKKTNELEWQKAPVDTMSVHQHQVPIADSSLAKDTLGR